MVTISKKVLWVERFGLLIQRIIHRTKTEHITRTKENKEVVDPMPIATKPYLSLKEAVNQMELTNSDVLYLVERCQLLTYVHLREAHALMARLEPLEKPDRQVQETEEDELFQVKCHSQKDQDWVWGQTPLLSTEDIDCSSRQKSKFIGRFFDLAPIDIMTASQVLRDGAATVTHFGDGEKFVAIPKDSPDALIEIDDLMVLKAMFDRICQQQGVEKKEDEWIRVPMINPEDYPVRPKVRCFSDFVFKGERLEFGEMQSAALQFLYDAQNNGSDGWVDGMRVLQAVGSNSRQFSQLFKHKSMWRDLIEWNGRKRYRLHPNFLADHVIDLKTAA